MHSSVSLRELSRGGVSFVRGDRSHHAGAPARGWLFYRINIGFSFSAFGSSAVLSYLNIPYSVASGATE